MHMSDTQVTITRRKSLQLAGWASSFFCLQQLARGQAGKAGSPFDRFTDQWLSLHDEFLADAEPDEDRYLYRLCALIAAVGSGAVPARSRNSYEAEGLQSGPAYGQGPQFIVEFELAPGAIVRAHNHVGYNFVSAGSKGSCAFRHFEPVGPPPPVAGNLGKPFELLETRRGILTPGRLTSLSRTRDSIHWFQAGDEGATFLDFGTKLDGPGAGWKEFSALEFDPDPVDPERGIYEGYWIGNPFK